MKIDSKSSAKFEANTVDTGSIQVCIRTSIPLETISEKFILKRKGPFTLSLAIAIPKNYSLAIAMLTKEMAYPTHSIAKFSAKICLFP